MKIPRAAGLPLISRLKIIANLDIADRLRPQDGRARVAINKKPVDLRVSTLPASQGEKVVIRILDATATVLALESLGLAEEETKAIQELLEGMETETDIHTFDTEEDGIARPPSPGLLRDWRAGL